MQNNDAGMGLFILGLGVIAIGGLPLLIALIVKIPVAKRAKQWDETTGVQLKSLDEQISIKSTELQRYQKVVSQ